MGSMFSGSGMSQGKQVTTSAVLLQEEQAFNGGLGLRDPRGTYGLEHLYFREWMTKYTWAAIIQWLFLEICD